MEYGLSGRLTIFGLNSIANVSMILASKFKTSSGKIKRGSLLSEPLCTKYLLHQISQHRVQDAAVAIVVYFNIGIQQDCGFEFNDFAI